MQLKAFVSQGNDTAFEKHREAYNNVGNYYASALQMAHYDSLMNATESKQDIMLSMSLLNRSMRSNGWAKLSADGF